MEREKTRDDKFPRGVDESVILRFQRFQEEDDEADFEVISSTKVRLDRFLSSAKQDEDDDILVISSYPRRILSPKMRYHYSNFETTSIVIAGSIILFTITIMVVGPTDTVRRFSSWFKRRKQTNRSNSSPPQQSSKPNPSNSSKVKSQKDDDIPALLLEGSRNIETILEKPIETIKVSAESSSEKELKTSKIKEKTTDHSARKELATLCRSPHSEANKIQVVTKMAQDIKLVQKVLQDNGVDASLAPHVAISLQTSERIIDSQHKVERGRLLFENHQRQLDRQLSERQHQESMQAAKYDPNWKEKLERKRDECWKVTTRIVIEVICAYKFSNIFRLLWNVYQNQRAMFSVPEVTRMVIQSACNCQSPQREHFPITLYTYQGLFGVDMNFESGLCYGYCLLSFSSILCLTALIHQGIRTFFLPSLFHNVVNLATVGMLYLGSYNEGHNLSEFIVSDGRFMSLLVGLIGLFVMVEWNFYQVRQDILANKSKAFEKAMDSGMRRMEVLYRELYFFRYFIGAMYCCTLFLWGQN